MFTLQLNPLIRDAAVRAILETEGFLIDPSSLIFKLAQNAFESGFLAEQLETTDVKPYYELCQKIVALGSRQAALMQAERTSDHARSRTDS